MEDTCCYTKVQLANTASINDGMEFDREIFNRQQCANYLQEMGQKLELSQTCINTAVVFMHRFFVNCSFYDYNKYTICTAALFLATKVEEQSCGLEQVVKASHLCLNEDASPLEVDSDAYKKSAQEIKNLELVLLMVLGFALHLEHPHGYVKKICELVHASEEMTRSAYSLATTSLHVTTMCLQYSPRVVACVCIYLSCKLCDFNILPCAEGHEEWFHYVERDLTLEVLDKIAEEFVAIMDQNPKFADLKLKLAGNRNNPEI